MKASIALHPNLFCFTFLFLLYVPGGWWVSAEAAGYVDKRGGPQDFYREHAKPLDVPWQQTDYKYGNGSLPGGILHNQIHFGGGSKMHQEDWRSPEIKGSASDWVKNVTASKKKKPQGIHTLRHVVLLLFIDFILRWLCPNNFLTFINETSQVFDVCDFSWLKLLIVL